MPRKRLLWLPHAPWVVSQRARFLAAHLAADFEIHVITWEGFAAFSELADMQRLWRSLTAQSATPSGSVVLHRVPQVPGGLYAPAIRKHNARVLEVAATTICAKHEIDALIVSSPMPTPNVGIPLIGDFIDDHGSYWRDVRGRPDIAQEIDESEYRLLTSADARFVVSHSLRDKCASAGYDATYVPNGVDIERIAGGDRTRFRQSLGVDEASVVVGYIGAFGEFSGLVRAVSSAAAWPSVYHLAVAGTGTQLAEAQRIVRERGLSHVHFLGWVDAVADFFAGIDVGLIPFDVIDFTSFACPIKLLEYVAVGLPVISTRLEEVERLGLGRLTYCEPAVESLTLAVRGLSRDLERSPVPAIDAFRWSSLAQQFAETVHVQIKERAT